MVNVRLKKKTPGWIVAVRKGGTTLQDAQILFKIRDATPEEARIAAAYIDPTWKLRGQTAIYFAAARKDPSADEICRFLRSRLGNEPVTKSDDWGQSPLFYAAREGHTQLCKYLVEKCAVGVNQVDRWGETPLFYAMKWQRLETAIYLLQSGASMGIVNRFGQSAERLANVEVVRELQSRMKEWAEPLEVSSPEQTGDSKKRKRPEEEEVEEPGSAAEGPRALQEWVAKPASFSWSGWSWKLPKTERTQLLREEPTVVEETTTHKAEEPAILAENTTHEVTLLTDDALEEVRELEKMLVAYQAALFQGHLFVQSCRALDFCSAFGAKEKDSEFFEESSMIVEDAGRGETGSLVLVARETETGEVVGYCRAEKSDGELVIRHLQVRTDQQGQGVAKLLLQAAETQALSAGWAFESVAARVLYLNSQAQQIFFRLGFDIHDEPAPGPAMSLLPACAKMIRRAMHAPPAPVEQTIMEPYVQRAFAPWHRRDRSRDTYTQPSPEV